MKIDLTTIDKTMFMVHEHVLNGKQVFLVQPIPDKHIDWNRGNKIFRSSLWDYEGNLISAGFPKFTNWGERPEQFPVPSNLNNHSVVEKLDGTLLIVTKWNGKFIIRTRGTIDASNLENGVELEEFKESILERLDNLHAGKHTWDSSFLFEWVSPAQRIVLSYGAKPDWYLIGAVNHWNYSLYRQSSLDVTAHDINVKRPQYHTFFGIADLLNTVDRWIGKEGVCVYSPDCQTIHKVKSAWYLMIHRMKSELSSFEKVVDMWLAMERPDYQTFYDKVARQFDVELANQIRGDISRICDGFKEIQKIVFGMNLFIKNKCLIFGDPKDKKQRTQMAFKIIGSYGENTSRAGLVFKLLDGKKLDDDDLKRLLFQVTKDNRK